MSSVAHGNSPPRLPRPEGLRARLSWRPRLPRDARIYQIAFQATLLLLGVVARDFSLRFEQMILCFVAGLATQAFWTSRLNLHKVGWLSPVITCLGLSLLLRSDSPCVHPLAATIAMSGK